MMPDKTRTWSVQAVWTVTFLIIASAVFIHELPGSSKPIPKDFAQYLVAGKVILVREPGALYFTDAYTGITTRSFPESRFAQIAADMGIAESSYYIYPPWVGLIYAPLTFFKPYHALLAAYVLGWGLFTVTLVLLAGSLPDWRWSAAGITFLLLIHTFTFEHGVISGQASIPLLFLLAMLGRALWRRRDAEAGMWWALATGLKLFPILFIPYFLVLRRWRILFSFLAAGAILLAVSVAVSDVPAHVRFLNIVRDYLHYTTPRTTNFSLIAFLLRLTTPTTADVWSVVEAPPALLWIHRAVFLAALAPVLWLARRGDRAASPWAPLLGFGLMTSWVLSASANVWSHQIVAMAIPLAVVTGYLLARGARLTRWWLAAWAAGWAGLFFYDVYDRLGGLGFTGLPHALLSSTPFFGLVILFALQVVLLRSATQEG